MGVVQGGDGAGRDLARLRAADRDDLARPRARSAGPEMDDQGDLPDRQDRPRHAALHAFYRAGDLDYLFHPAPLEGAAFEMAAPGHPVRSAFPADLLPRGVPVILCALDLDAIYQGRLGATRRLPCRHPDSDRRSV